jgi:hypothetical protein
MIDQDTNMFHGTCYTYAAERELRRRSDLRRRRPDVMLPRVGGNFEVRR